jgi:hypothetical protein
MTSGVTPPTPHPAMPHDDQPITRAPGLRAPSLARASTSAALVCVLLIWSVWSTGCGVGASGTGSGAGVVPAPTPTSGASTTLCSADFAATSLACGGAATPSPGQGPSTDGTAPIVWSDAGTDSASAGVRARLSGDTIVLEAACLGLRFEGTWTALSDGSVAYFGRYTSSTVSTPTDAVLRVRAATDVAPWTVLAQLRDPRGQAIDATGTEWRLRVVVDDTAPSCPGS